MKKNYFLQPEHRGAALALVAVTLTGVVANALQPESLWRNLSLILSGVACAIAVGLMIANLLHKC